MSRYPHPVDPAVKRLTIVVLVAVVTAAGAVGTAAQGTEDTADARRVLAGVQGWLDGTRDLRARFEQQLLSGAFGAGTVESGRLSIRRPGQMRWDYLDPEPKVALVEGDRTSLYLEEERQLILGRLDSENELLTTLLVGDRRLAQLFRVELEPAPDGGAYRLRLSPQREADAFEAVIITTRAPLYAIESAEVLDAAGSRMLYRFWKMRRNQGVTDKLFQLEPGPGVDVSGSHEAP